MKRLILGLVIFLAVTGGAFAQNNAVTGGAGGGFSVPLLVYTEFFASYERTFIPQLSASVNGSIQLYPVAGFVIAFAPDVVSSVYTFIIEGQAHWYPFKKRSFHVDAGLGYGYYLGNMHTLVVAPGVGWKWDFGKPGGFIMNLGLRSEYFIPLSHNVFEGALKKLSRDDESPTLKPFNPLSVRLSFGYAF